MNEKKWIVVVISFVLIALVVPNIVLAKPGGIKVSDPLVNCGDSQKETRLLPANTNNGAQVWYNFPSNDGSNTIDRWYTISCRSGDHVPCTRIRLNYCGTVDPNYYHADFDTIG